MKTALLVTMLSVAATSVGAAQTAVRGSAAASSDKVGEAYAQFLLGRHLEGEDDLEGAIAAYKRASELDPTAADALSELAALYMRQNRLDDAVGAGEQALKIAPANREAHRVLGIVYATMADTRRGSGQRSRQPASARTDNLTKAIDHLEQALEKPVGEPDPNVRATLSRLYIATGQFEKAIPILTELVTQEPGWNEGPKLLAEAYASAGRNDEAIRWLEEMAPNDPQLYPTLGDFYERQRRWKDAANAYSLALKGAPRNAELKTRYASALLNIGGREEAGRARDVLTDVVSTRADDARALYLLSQAQRRLGDLSGAEQTARKVIAQNAQSVWGYYALAEAFEEQRKYQALVDALTQPVADFRSRSANDQAFTLGLLLPHLGFAQQELGQHDKAIAAFEEAHRLSPKDSAITGYLIQANLTAKKYSTAIDLARQARAQDPDDLRFARLEAQALRQSGKADQGIAVLQDVVQKRKNDPAAYVALAQLYAEASRGGDAVKLLQEAAPKFSSDTSILFELGAILDKEKRHAESEAVFHQVLAKDPEHAAALNYLGYMLAERGDKLDQSVGYIKRALALEPENGSYLDSLGWAYFKAEKLDLAVDNLQRAADQLKTNSVIQDHYADVLFKLGRYDEAIAAWTRALNGDGDSIDRGSIDKKIRAARQKIRK